MQNEINKSDKALYDFFTNLDRTQFLEDEFREYAHEDRPLPIGHEQTISQPTMVYTMTSKLQLDKRHKVLEIGTGSGYQTAFLAEFAGQVYTVERIKELSWKAVQRLMTLGYGNVQFRIGDGSEGWPDYAPYDRIIVTAAANEVPETLVEQLKPEGRMLVPVGKKGIQDLLLIQKNKDGKVRTESLGDVIFVEFKGKYGWKH
jgi:protein-L-isoaspartate(D-aspartate) O-methyltransferase